MTVNSNSPEERFLLFVLIYRKKMYILESPLLKSRIGGQTSPPQTSEFPHYPMN